MALLRPQGIGDVKLNALLLSRLVQLVLERAKGRIELPRVLAEVQDLGHLRRGIPACAAVGHGQASGNAIRRKEEVGRAALKTAVEIQGEGGVALNERLALGCLCACGQRQTGGEHQAHSNDLWK